MIYNETLDDDQVHSIHSQPSVLDCIGHTPLVPLKKLFPQPNLNVFAKLEFLNPSGSIKDRIAKYIIMKAELTGKLKPDSTIVEASSGNTATAIAMVAAIRGYRAILVMPAKASKEKQISAAALGAEVIVCSSDVNYITKAAEIAKNTPDSFLVDQYNNLDNINAHFSSTGPEIWASLHGEVDYFVAGASTGGTVSGVGRYLKSKNQRVKIVAPDPIGSIYGPYHRDRVVPATNGKYLVEGIGKDCLAGCMDFSIIDEILPFSDDQAFAAARKLAREEGIFAGGSSGANIWACAELAKTLTKPCTIVTILPDSGFKYLSTIYSRSE